MLVQRYRDIKRLLSIEKQAIKKYLEGITFSDFD